MESVKLMNMCKIIDINTNRVLIQERVKNWKGIAFPGGKINNGESITKSMIREVKEETGLDITDLELCGVKNWYNEEKNERSIVFLYQTKNFAGNLISETEEGKNYWISEEELLKKELADNFDIMLKVFTKNNFSEMIYNNKTKDWNLF